MAEEYIGPRNVPKASPETIKKLKKSVTPKSLKDIRKVGKKFFDRVEQGWGELAERARQKEQSRRNL